MYRIVSGQEVTGSEAEDTNPEPKSADDLMYPRFSLDKRTKQLDGLCRLKKQLRRFETVLILNPLPSDPSPKDKEMTMEEVVKKVSLLKAKIELYSIKSPCETEHCVAGSPLLPIYQNRCTACASSEKPKSKSDARQAGTVQVLKSNLLSIRNIIVRIEFLEEQISSSLSNLLKEEELASAMKEAETLTSWA
jgi:hypothetical protein